MNNQAGHWELRYNIVSADNCDHQYHDDLAALFRVANTFVNPWEIVRASDGALLYADETEKCAYCDDQRMRGWRVCLTCAEARAIDPNGYKDEPPDRIEGIPGVSPEFITWDLNHLHAEWPS